MTEATHFAARTRCCISHAILRTGRMLALAFAIVCLQPTDAWAQPHGDFNRALGGLIGQLFRQAQINQQRIDQARQQWGQVERDVQICLIKQYQILPKSLADHGISPYHPQVQPLVTACRQAIAEQKEGLRQQQIAEDQARQDELRRQAEAAEQVRQDELRRQAEAEEQAHQDELRRQAEADEQARQDELRRQHEADKIARREELRRRHAAELQAREEQTRRDQDRQRELADQNLRRENAAAGTTFALVLLLVLAGIAALAFAVSRLRRAAKKYRPMTTSKTKIADPSKQEKPLFGLVAPMLCGLAFAAYATFVGPGRLYEPLVAEIALVLMLIWSVKMTLRFVVTGRQITAEDDHEAPLPADEVATGLTRGLFFVALGIATLVVSVHAAREMFLHSGLPDPDTLQLLLTGAFAFVLVLLAVHLGVYDPGEPGEPALIARPAMYFLFTFLGFLGMGLLFGFLSGAVPREVLRLAVEFRFALAGLAAVLVLIDAGRLFGRAIKGINERIEKAAADRKTDSENVIVLLVWGTIDVLLRIAHFVLLSTYEFVKSIFKAAFRAIATAGFFIVTHSVALAALVAAVVFAPQAFDGIEQYMFDGSMSLVPAITVACFLALTGVVAVVEYLTTHFAWPRPSANRNYPVIAFTLGGIWLASVLIHIVKTATGYGPAAFGFPNFGVMSVGGIVVLVLVALVTRKRKAD